jgi:hypothetical protein
MKNEGGFRLDLGQDISCFCSREFGVVISYFLNLHSSKMLANNRFTEGLDDSRGVSGKVGIGNVWRGTDSGLGEGKQKQGNKICNSDLDFVFGVSSFFGFEAMAAAFS